MKSDRETKTASAPKRDPTGKYTLNGWGQTEADFAFFDLAQDKVELKSDGWRTEKIADDPNVYEWWYFDIHNHDGTVITGILSPQTAIGRGPRLNDTRPSPSNARTVRDWEGGRCRCSGSTTKRRRRSSCAPRPWMT